MNPCNGVELFLPQTTRGGPYCVRLSFFHFWPVSRQPMVSTSCCSSTMRLRLIKA